MCIQEGYNTTLAKNNSTCAWSHIAIYQIIVPVTSCHVAHTSWANILHNTHTVDTDKIQDLLMSTKFILYVLYSVCFLLFKAYLFFLYNTSLQLGYKTPVMNLLLRSCCIIEMLVA